MSARRNKCNEHENTTNGLRDQKYISHKCSYQRLIARLVNLRSEQALNSQNREDNKVKIIFSQGNLGFYETLAEDRRNSNGN